MGEILMARVRRGRPKSSQPTMAERRDRRVFVSLSLNEIEQTNSVSVLPLSEQLIIELLARGYQTVGDLAGLTALHAIQIPSMNGSHWQIICAALRQTPFPEIAIYR